jgi:hypothetical protein
LERKSDSIRKVRLEKESQTGEVSSNRREILSQIELQSQTGKIKSDWRSKEEKVRLEQEKSD